MDPSPHRHHSSVQLLSEGEVLDAIDCLSAQTAKKAAESGSDLHPELPQNHGQFTAAALYCAALKSADTSPGIDIPGSQTMRQLCYSTCPPTFLDWFQRWAQLVQRIKHLPEQEGSRIERRLLMLSNSDDACVPRSDTLIDIAGKLRKIAQDITSYRQSYDHGTIDVLDGRTVSPRVQPTINDVGRRNNPTIQHPTPRHSFHPLPGNSRIWRLVNRSGQQIAPSSFRPGALYLSASSGPMPSLVGSASQRSRPIDTPSSPTGSNTTYYTANASPRSYSPEDMHRHDSVSGPSIYAPNRPTPLKADSTSSISDYTSVSKVIDRLCDRGFSNLTNRLDPTVHAVHPVSRGGYGEVYRGKLTDGTDVALKLLAVVEGDYNESLDLKHAALELYTWSKCDHPNIAKLLGLAEYKGRIATVSPWMENGNLRDYVRRYPNVDRLDLCIQIADALAHMHSSSVGIVHGKLSGNNVLLSQDGTPFVTNFGCSVVSEGTIQPTGARTKRYTSIRWSAPEIMNENKVSEASDVYAGGMVFLEAFTSVVPHATKNHAEVGAAVTRGHHPDRPNEFFPTGEPWSDALWSCMMACWRFRPQDRPSAAEVYQRLQEVSVMRIAAANPRDSICSEDSVMTAISSQSSVTEIIDQVGSRNCKNVTRELNLSACDSRPRVRGGFGDVYRGRLNDGRYVALKLISDSEPKDLKHTAREIHTWSKCDHKNIAKLFGLAVFKSRIAIVSAWMDNGNIRQYVRQHPDANRLDLCSQIASALMYLHSDLVGIVHGDLKGDNVLVSYNGIPALIDFGCSVISERSLPFTQTRTKHHMTIRWSAPEIMDQDTVSQASDVYALGMIFLEVFTGEVPYPTTYSHAAVVTAVTRGQIPARPPRLIPTSQRQSNMLWDCMTACWKLQPQDRPTAAEVYQRLQDIPSI